MSKLDKFKQERLNYSLLRITNDKLFKEDEYNDLGHALDSRYIAVNAHPTSNYFVIDDELRFQHDLKLNDVLDLKALNI